MGSDGRIRHLSPSKIETALKCGVLAMLRYERRVPEPSAGVLSAGIVVHTVLEEGLKAVLQGSALPSAHELDDRFVPAWEERIAEEEGKPTFLGWDWKDETEEKVRDECRALVAYARERVLPERRPRLVEDTLKFQYQSEAGPFLVWGKLDHLDESGVLEDWKTTASVSDYARRTWLAMGYYSRRAVEVTGEEWTRARKVFLVRGPEPSHDVQDYLIGPPHREWFARCAAAVWRAVRARTFMPAPDGAWWCKEGMCSYWGMCKGKMQEVHVGEQREAVEQREAAQGEA
jgi:hypothetical protein